MSRVMGFSVARNDVAVKVDLEVIRMARHVAVDKRVPLAEYLSERLRPLVVEDYEALAQRMAGEPRKSPFKKGARR